MRCCCRATPSARSASRACARTTSTSPATSTSSTPSGRCTPRARRPTRSRSPTSCAAAGLLEQVGGAEALHAPAERHAGDLQRRPLRPHRPGHGAAAAADRRRRRHRRDGLRRARRRHQGRRRGRVQGLQGRRGPGHRLDPAAQRIHQGGHGPASRRRSPGATRSPARPPATTTSTSCSRACSRRTLNIVGARPAMGKTAFGLGMAAHVAQTTGRARARVLARDGPQRADPAHPVAARPRSTRRRCATAASASPTGPRSAGPSGASRCRLFLDDNPSVTVMEIRAKARRLKAAPWRPGPDRHRLPPADDAATAPPRTARSRSARSAGT